MAIKICLSFLPFLESLFEELLAFLSKIGIFGFAMFIFKALGAVCLGAASRILKSKIEKTAASVVVGVVGIGLLVGSLSLLSEPVHDGRRIVNTCAPLVSYVEVTNDGSSGFRVKVMSLRSDGWEQFPSDSSGYHKYFTTYGAVYHPFGLRGDFLSKSSYRTRWSGYGTVHFDYFARGGTGGKYFEMKIKPAYHRLVHVRDKHYWGGDHYVNITLYVTDRDGSNKGKRLPNGGYKMHCWISDNDGNGYGVTVYLDNDGDGSFEHAF